MSLTLVQLEASRRWRKENRERVLEYARLYRIKNKDIIKRRRQAYVKYYNSLTTTKLRYQRWHKLNFKKLSLKVKLWRCVNSDKIRLYRKVINANQRYSGKLTVRDVQRLYENNIKEYGTLTCVICKKPIIFGDDSIDHNFCSARGGTNDYGNLQIAHVNCNNKKRSRTLQELWEEKNA